MSDSLVLKIFSVNGHRQTENCDCILLSIAEDLKGKFSGSYGIKKGHARAIFSLCQGRVVAKKGDEIIFEAETSEGFATVEDNVVRVTVDSIGEINK